jgi:meso-butanediol dehydrogenase / (S,S)-butanediol dehydrogenase / diacetyl reductase
MMSTNADSCFSGARAALVYLTKTCGSIVHIASASGVGGDRNQTAFNAAKGAVVNFTRGLALDLGPSGIRVNAVSPALTMSHERAESGQFDKWLTASSERQALTGYCTPEDVAGAATFLASDDARFVTGVILPVDGGVTAASGQPYYSRG